MRIHSTTGSEAFVSPYSKVAMLLIAMIISANSFASSVAGEFAERHIPSVDGRSARKVPIPASSEEMLAVNSAPAFGSSSYSFTISDEAPAGAAVGGVKATDADGGAPAYAIMSGNTNKALAINAGSGALTVAKLLNYHTQNTYSLRVRATDATGLYSETTVTVNVTAGTTVPYFKNIAWSNIASLPYGTHEVHGEVVNGKLYIFGGYDVQKRPAWTPTKRSYVYDPGTNKWSPIRDLPHTPNGTNFGGITHVGLTTDGTDVYFAGGYTSNSDGTGQVFGTKQVWRYNVGSDTYTALPSLPIELAAGQLRYLKGKLHYMGGANKSRQDIADHYELDLDNLSAGWKASAPLNDGKNHPGSAVCEGKLYFIGGSHHQDANTVTQKTVEVYDPATNKWTFVAEMPTAVDHISSSVTVIGNRILVIGGETSHNIRTSKIQAYTPGSNSWEELSPMPKTTAAGVAGTIQGTLFYSGGNFSAVSYKGVPGVSTNQQQVSSFTLVNSDTRTDIQALPNGATLNLATLPTKNLNIRANTSPSTVGSVVFALSGTASKSATESRAPYDLMGDNGAWTPAVGNYSLKATPYTSTGGSGTAGTALTVSFSVVNQPSSGLVSNVSASSGRSYALADLAVGVRHYTDRTYQVTSVPSLLAGASLIRTANDDKRSTSSSLLSFTLSQQATVYVVYDPRATALPSWLSGWQKLTDRVGVSDSQISYMELYSKSFPAGTVTLGGNMLSPAAGAQTNYFVLARAAQAPSADLIVNITPSSGRSYVASELITGHTYYTDRTYTLSSVPASLAGAPFIKTANDDKKNTSATALSFELTQNATVYVAYDPRATALPSWLSGWQKLPDRVGVNDSQISYMELYSKSFAAGTVTLGGAMQSPAAGAQNNYFVIATTAQAAVASSNRFATESSPFEEESSHLALLLYPNPAAGERVQIQVSNFGKQETVNITMHDVLGRVCSSADVVTDHEGNAKTELAGGRHLQPGIYIIRAKGISGKVQEKLLVR